MKYLLKMSEDYADEFQCEQFKIVDTLELAEDLLETISNEEELYFGTNEYLEGADITVETHPITDEEALVIRKFLGDTFGTGVLNLI